MRMSHGATWSAVRSVLRGQGSKRKQGPTSLAGCAGRCLSDHLAIAVFLWSALAPVLRPTSVAAGDSKTGRQIREFRPTEPVAGLSCVTR
jgi:hypothetical protein